VLACVEVAVVQGPLDGLTAGIAAVAGSFPQRRRLRAS